MLSCRTVNTCIWDSIGIESLVDKTANGGECLEDQPDGFGFVCDGNNELNVICDWENDGPDVVTLPCFLKKDPPSRMCG